MRVSAEVPIPIPESQQPARRFLLAVPNIPSFPSPKLGIVRRLSIIFRLSMPSSLQSFLIAECAYFCAYNLFFCVLLCRKVLKLDKLSDNLEVTMPRTTWLKFLFILFIILLMIAHIIFSYSQSNYWQNIYPNYSLISLLFIVNYTMQLYIVVREVRKCKRRHLAGIMYWVVAASTFLIEIIVVENLLPKPNATIIIQVLIFLLNLGLVLITLIFERFTLESKDTFLNVALNPSVRSIENSIIRSEFVPRSHLYIEFNKEFEITQKKGETACEFKIAVYFQDSVKIVTKSQEDFVRLAEQLVKIFPHNAEVALPAFTHKYENMMKYGMERQKYFQPYLVELIKTDQFYCPPLLEFLELPNTARIRLGTTQRFPFAKKESLYSEQEDRFRVPFFKVSAHKNSILISNPDILELIINKSKQEIVDFHDKLIDQKRLSMQLLPQNPSHNDFMHFFDIVVNRKMLWRSFAVWFGLGGQLQEKIYNYFDVWNIGFRNVEMKVVGNEKNFDKEGKIHTLYLLSIQRRHQRHSQMAEGEVIILKKRYSDFFALNKEVLRFVSKNRLKADKLPEMPPKLSPFGSQTSPKSRVARFDYYIKELMKIQGINHCIKLLEFLQVDSHSCPSDLYESAEVASNLFQHSERSYFSDLMDKTPS